MPAKREDRIKEITERLEQGIRELFTSERYTEYLQTMSQFHHYSFNNTVLIAMQKPDATLVAGYQAWQKKFNRHVKRGEKGIQIIAPAPIREKYEVEKIDPATQEPVLKEDGQPETEEVVHIIPRFRVSTVFDVSQTEGDPLPELIEVNLTANVENFEYFMQAIRAVSPVTIRFDEISTDANGYYSLTDKEIVIQSGMSESQTMKTAIHEVTHAMLHDRDTMALLGEEKDQMTRETEAESVAYTVCQFFGLDTSDYSFPYVASWSSGMELKELRESMDTIRKTAGDFIESMSEQLKILMQEQSLERQTPTAAQQAQRLVDESPFRSQISPEEVDLVISYAHKFDDVELARRLLTRIERGIQEAEPLMIEEAEQEARDWIDRLPDREIGLSEMHEYGYHQDDMYPLTKESALELHRMGFKIYCLEPDGTAGEFASREMIEAHHGIFGIHREDWNQELERPDEEIMENSAYLHPPMTALGKEAALEFFDAGETVYLITTNPIPIPADNRMEIERGSDEFQVSVDSFEKIRRYREEMQNRPELRSLREANLFLNEEDQYGIYQVREDSAAREYRFMPLDYVQEKGFHLSYEGFNLVYSGHLYPGDTLDGIFEKFNIDHPEDFTGHSLSVSDVVVLKKDGELTAYYVDRFGFPVLENFLPVLEEKTNQITMDSSWIRVDGHEGTWHPVEMQEINGTVFYLMEHDTFGSSVAKVALDQNGRLAAEDLWNGFDEGAREAIAEFLDSASREKMTGKEMKEPFISRYYVVNDAYGIKAERVYQYFDNLDEALTAYHQLPNHFDKQIGMESTEQPPSQMSLITCRNGMETLTDIEAVSLGEKWVKEDVMDAKNKAEFYLDNRDTEIAFQLKGGEGYFFIQTSADGEYDYTFYGRDFREQDGGIYDASELSTQEAIDNILADAKGLSFSACEVIDCEKFLETAEWAESYLDQKEVRMLAEDIDKFAYDHDFYEYQDHVEDREQSVREVINELTEGKADSVKEWLQGFADEGEPGETVSEAQSLIGRIDTAIERNLLQPKEKAEPKISFYVAECMEFPVLGEYQDNLTLKEAFEQYQSIPADRMNGVKGIGFRLEDGSMYDGEYQLMSGDVISYDLIDLVPHYRESPLVQNAISELEEMLSHQKEQGIVSPQHARSEKEPDIPEEKKNSRKQSVLLALRARQEKQKAQEKDKEPRKTQTHKKGEQEL